MVCGKMINLYRQKIVELSVRNQLFAVVILWQGLANQSLCIASWRLCSKRKPVTPPSNPILPIGSTDWKLIVSLKPKLCIPKISLTSLKWRNCSEMCFFLKLWKHEKICVLQMQSQKEIINEMLYRRYILLAWEVQIILFELAVGSQKG